MPDNKKPRRASEIVDAIFDFAGAPDAELRDVPLEDIKRDLRKAGIDPAPVVETVLGMLEAARAARRLLHAREERRRLLAQANSKVTPRRDTGNRYTQAIAQSGGLFRKLEGVTANDQASTLDDLDLLDEMNKHDEGESSD